MLRSLFVASEALRRAQRLLFNFHNHLPPPAFLWLHQPQLIGGFPSSTPSSLLDHDDEHEEQPQPHDSIWRFAVPKKRVTRSKKRLKTTVQYRIQPRQNIITDPRTGELTLRHRLPHAWEDYLPEPPAVELSVYKKLRKKRYLEEEEEDEQKNKKR